MKDINQVKEILDNFYVKQINVKHKKNDTFKCESIYNEKGGLGDSIILTSILPFIKVNNIILPDINEKYINKNNLTHECSVSLSEIADNDWDGGHSIQRIQRSLGLPVSIKPKGIINYDESKKIKGKVFIHWSNNTDWKRKIPNSLELEQKKIIREFLQKNNYIFVYYSDFFTINDIINNMETCEYFLGIDSGPMHIAAALNLKSIVIINDPHKLIYLPKIKECDLPNSEWLYPQNVHLNRSGETELIPEFNYQNLVNAFNGNIYPYWKDDYLDIK